VASVERSAVPRTGLLLIACIALGLGIGTIAGFLVGLLRPHTHAGSATVYVPPPSAQDEQTSVEPPARGER
jgi:hypothetical protein